MAPYGLNGEYGNGVEGAGVAMRHRLSFAAHESPVRLIGVADEEFITNCLDSQTILILLFILYV